MTDYPAVQNPDRCPTHPGALLRKEILPALGRSKTESPRCSGYPANICTMSWRSGNPCPQAWPPASASFSGMDPEYGYGCKRLTTPGTPNVKSTSAESLQFGLLRSPCAGGRAAA